MKTKGGGKHNKKNTIFVPATSRLPWREYRASLVRGETPLHLRRVSRESGVWCHEIPVLEPGCLLIESPSKSFDDQRYFQHSPLLASIRIVSFTVLFIHVRVHAHQTRLLACLASISPLPTCLPCLLAFMLHPACTTIQLLPRNTQLLPNDSSPPTNRRADRRPRPDVLHSASDHPEMQGVETGRRVILVAKHSPTGGSVGLVINQPTPMCIGDLTHRMPEFGDNAIHMGGNSHLEQRRGRKGKGELHTVHTVRGLKGGEELQDGVFYGADIRQALETVNLGLASSDQFRFFYGSTRWEGGQLEAEIANGDW
jgi:putative AlgH/UPF0301 family transcriptional regulator